MANLIELRGKEELLAKLEKMGNLDAAKAGLFAAAIYLNGKLQAYPESGAHPTRESVYGTAFKTIKQRRAFFAKLRKGLIEVPYHRGGKNSERFKASWTAQADSDGMTITLGNDTSYGPQLMGDTQSIYMNRLGWRKISEIVDEERGTVLGIISDSIDAAVEE